MSALSSDNNVVDRTIQEYRERGYRVESDSFLPNIDKRMPHLSADFVAVSEDEIVIVEVKARGDGSTSDLADLARWIEPIPGARLDVIWLGEVTRAPELAIPLGYIRDAREVWSIQPAAALLLAWAALEGVLVNRLVAEEIPVVDGPSAKQMLTDLYGNSLISWTRYVRLAGCARARNAVAHGGKLAVSEEDFLFLASSVEFLGGPEFRPFEAVLEDVRRYFLRFTERLDSGQVRVGETSVGSAGGRDSLRELSDLIPRGFTVREIEELLFKLLEHGDSSLGGAVSHREERSSEADNMSVLLNGLRQSAVRVGEEFPGSGIVDDWDYASRDVG